MCRAFWMSASLVALVGCPTQTDSPSDSPSAQNSEEPLAVESPKVEVALASWQEIEKRIGTHKGKPVVVDLWSTTCAPCKREFPHLVALHEEYKGRVECLAVSMDYYGDETLPPESFLPDIETFLTQQNAEFQNFICTDVIDDVLADLGATSVPTVLVYNAEGELVKMFEDDGTFGDEGFTYQDHIAPFVVDLINNAQ